jgi:hypothetical protein
MPAASSSVARCADGVPAVHTEADAGDEIVLQEKQHGLGHVLGFPSRRIRVDRIASVRPGSSEERGPPELPEAIHNGSR